MTFALRAFFFVVGEGEELTPVHKARQLVARCHFDQAPFEGLTFGYVGVKRDHAAAWDGVGADAEDAVAFDLAFKELRLVLARCIKLLHQQRARIDFAVFFLNTHQVIKRNPDVNVVGNAQIFGSAHIIQYEFIVAVDNGNAFG